MNKCLRLAYLYHDGDILDISVSVWNGRFGGQANMYISHGELVEAASNLAGFPASSSHKREIAFGSFGTQSAGGAARLKFSCMDLAGHGQVAVEIEEGRPETESPQTTYLLAPIEAAAVDLFVPLLCEIEKTLCGEAILQFS